MEKPAPKSWRVLVASPLATPFEITEGGRALHDWAAGAFQQLEAAGDEPVVAVAIPEGLTVTAPPHIRLIAVPSPRAAAAWPALLRTRLAREALEVGADAVWFLDIGADPPPGAWAALRAELVAGAGVALVPRLLPGLEEPGVLILAREKGPAGERLAPALIAARQCRPTEGSASFPVIGGSLECAAVPIATFGLARFGPPLPGWGPLPPDAQGWFASAREKQIPVRAVVLGGARGPGGDDDRQDHDQRHEETDGRQRGMTAAENSGPA